MLQNWQTQHQRRAQAQPNRRFLEVQQEIEQDGNYCPNINEVGFDAYLMFLAADSKGRIRKDIPQNTVALGIGPNILSRYFELEGGLLYQVKFIQTQKNSRKAQVNTSISLYLNTQGETTYYNTSKLRDLAIYAGRLKTKSLIVDCSDPLDGDIQILGWPSLHAQATKKSSSAKHYNRIK